jgi:hypothetical protein
MVEEIVILAPFAGAAVLLWIHFRRNKEQTKDNLITIFRVGRWILVAYLFKDLIEEYPRLCGLVGAIALLIWSIKIDSDQAGG